MKDWLLIREATAWQSIGWDGGPFRLKGGRVIYETVMYNCATARSNRVKLSRLGNLVNNKLLGLKEYSRYVDADTVLEFLRPIYD